MPQRKSKIYWTTNRGKEEWAWPRSRDLNLLTFLSMTLKAVSKKNAVLYVWTLSRLTPKSGGWRDVAMCFTSSVLISGCRGEVSAQTVSLIRSELWIGREPLVFSRKIEILDRIERCVQINDSYLQSLLEKLLWKGFWGFGVLGLAVKCW